MNPMMEIPTPGLFQGHYLATVVSVQDPEQLTRVQVQLVNFNGTPDAAAAIWARVAVPFAGDNRGAFLLPDVGDEVLIAFVNGDSRLPVVVGGLWNGRQPAPETLPGGSVDRWSIVSKAGSRIAIVEESPATATISFETPGGVTGTLTDRGGGAIQFSAGGCTVTLNGEGLSVQTLARVKVEATQVEVNAGQVNVNAAISNFSGMVRCDVMQATTVIATTYTPGAGNIW
jgi:uncharacterized protein involved in type VI secretion and phage assembly